MGIRRFSTVIVSGHGGQCAVEVPFDPTREWGEEPRPIRPGRRGHPASATLEGHAFDSFIVARMRRFWLLVDADVMRATGAATGAEVGVTVRPRAPAEARNRKDPRAK